MHWQVTAAKFLLTVIAGTCFTAACWMWWGPPFGLVCAGIWMFCLYPCIKVIDSRTGRVQHQPVDGETTND